MEIIYVEGCGASLRIDGVEEYDLTDEKRKEVTKKVCDWLATQPEYLNNLLQDIVPVFSEEVEDLGRCEQCGDWTTIYKLKID